jgi:hypothetical protein
MERVLQRYHAGGEMKALRYAISIFLALLPCVAWANCNPLPALDGGGVSTNMATATNGSSQCFFFYGLVDSTGANAIPTVAALADTTTNPTTFLSGALNFAYNGTTWDRILNGHGTAAKSLRVELPTDGTGVVGLNAGTNLVGKFGIDQTTPGTTNNVSLGQIGATTVSSGSGAAGAGSQRVAVATDTATIAGSAPSAIAGCAGATPANTFVKPINNAGSASNLLLVSKVASQNVYICAINLVVKAAVDVALVEGTLTTNPCDTATAGMAGGTTAATGWPLEGGPGGGLTEGNGHGIIFKTATVNHDVCLFFGAATQASGAITWMQAP